MPSLVLTIKGSGVAALKQDSSVEQSAIQDITNYLSSLASGNNKGTVYAQSSSANPVAASATLTVVSAVATDTVVIGPTTFTFTSTPSLSTDVEVDGASDTLDAAALAAAINAHATVSQVVTATSATNVVTVTAKQRGVVGNFINISTTGGTITASAANLASGTGGVTDAEASYNFGE